MLSDINIQLLQKKGITPSELQKQVGLFEAGFPFIVLDRPAKINDGIYSFNKAQQDELIKQYDNAIKRGIKPMKFIPASGAASRMFKDYFEYIDSTLDESEPSKAISEFIDNKEKFAFWQELHHLITQNGVANNNKETIKLLLNSNGLNYGNSPKGILKFHKYPNIIKTPVDEHLTEGAQYCKANNNEVYLHFTVSPEHKTLFENTVEQSQALLEKEFGVKFIISFSFQKSSTDTVAVTLDNKPFLKESGELLFRPSGHGALIENLNDLDADIIFIKNIDNVVADNLLADTIHYKKVIGGVLLTLQSDIFSAIKALDFNGLDNATLENIVNTLQTKWGLPLSSVLLAHNLNQKIDLLKNKLSKPIRVCGMVKNEGEPGGGPFWCKSTNGTSTLQIVESSQIDPAIKQQQHILRSSSHFNPVDLVVATKDVIGEPFNLSEFVDRKAGFISEKSLNGKPLKAMELPGLWNGAMSDWITVFVEVPIITFNPVKTLNDLLRTAHQPK